MILTNRKSAKRMDWSRSLFRFSLVMAIGFFVGGREFTAAQSFNSGSDGSDGALNLTTPGTILFDPKTFNPPLDPDGDNIYHFTTINIAAGVTVRLSAQVLRGPVFWLASGNVRIDGTIDLNGRNGHTFLTFSSQRIPSEPGAGGYAGGVGGTYELQQFVSPQPGNGPGGGLAASAIIGGSSNASGGTFTGNQFLVPVVGGSGGGGAARERVSFGAGGGAGGGALLIASSTLIVINGSITAQGGTSECGNCNFGCGNCGGAGSGGAIRLIANTISGTGSVSVIGGRSYVAGGDGRIRVETFQNSFTGSFSGPVTLASPFNTFLPSVTTSVRVVSVGGVPMPSSPMGSFTVPDVAINEASAVSVTIEARGIPVGTTVKLHFFSENGPDQFVDSTPLSGTLALSSASANVTFPPGFTRGFVRATWTQ